MSQQEPGDILQEYPKSCTQRWRTLVMIQAGDFLAEEFWLFRKAFGFPGAQQVGHGSKEGEHNPGCSSISTVCHSREVITLLYSAIIRLHLDIAPSLGALTRRKTLLTQIVQHRPTETAWSWSTCLGRTGWGIWASSAWTQLLGDVTRTNSTYSEATKKMEEGSSVAHRSHGMRGNINKFKQERLKMHIRKNFFTMRAVKQWSRLPRKVVQSLQVFRTQQDKALSNLVQPLSALLWAGSWTRDFLRCPPTQTILSYL